MTLHLKSRGYPFRPRLLFSSFIVAGVGFPTVYYFRRGQVVFTAEVHKDRSLCGVKRHGLGVLRLGAFVELFLDIWFLEGWIVRGLG